MSTAPEPIPFKIAIYGFSGPTTELGVDTAKDAAAADDIWRR
ncbi:hypothetical protein [Mycobacterium florentinum]|nr:hypothetical protein [Mycobacterium florentinum]